MLIFILCGNVAWFILRFSSGIKCYPVQSVDHRISVHVLFLSKHVRKSSDKIVLVEFIAFAIFARASLFRRRADALKSCEAEAERRLNLSPGPLTLTLGFPCYATDAHCCASPKQTTISWTRCFKFEQFCTCLKGYTPSYEENICLRKWWQLGIRCYRSHQWRNAQAEKWK